MNRDDRADKIKDGLEFLHAIKEGRIPPPPAWRLLDCVITGINEGIVTLEMTPAWHHCNRFGVVQGGILCTLLDASMACTLSSALPHGTGFGSAEIKVSYFRPVTIEMGVIRSEGSIIHKERRIAVLEGRITDGEGRLCAHSMSTFMISGKK